MNLLLIIPLLFALSQDLTVRFNKKFTFCPCHARLSHVDVADLYAYANLHIFSKIFIKNL